MNISSPLSGITRRESLHRDANGFCAVAFPVRPKCATITSTPPSCTAQSANVAV